MQAEFSFWGGMQALSEDALAPSPWGVWEKGIVSRMTHLALLYDICLPLLMLYYFSTPAVVLFGSGGDAHVHRNSFG